MTIIRKAYLILFFFILSGCANKKTNDLSLEMTKEELVSALIQLYTVNAAININDVDLRDSTSQVYFKQMESIMGKPMDVIRSDIEKLRKMPDSLLVIQGIALDTLRAIQERQILKPANISIGLN
jgi:signal recognition particle receptor subunit beta